MTKLLFLLLLLCCLSSYGCIFYSTGGSKLYNVSSQTPEGKKAIEDYQMQFISEVNFSLFFADYSRDSGFCVANPTTLENGSIAYQTINKEYAVTHKIEPDFSLWDEYGCWVISVLVAGIIFFLIKCF